KLEDGQIGAIRRGLKDAGYIEGLNVAIKYRSADSRFDRLPALVADPVSDSVDAIVALSPPAALAIKAATTTIPIVFATGADPIDLGLVSSLNRPGGNVTGVTFIVNTLGAKRLGMMRELVPSANVSASSSTPGIPLLNPRLEMCRPQRTHPASSPLSCLSAANAISTRLSRASSNRVRKPSSWVPIRCL